MTQILAANFVPDKVPTSRVKRAYFCRFEKIFTLHPKIWENSASGLAVAVENPDKLR
jgi:hypothetical protein